MHTTKPIIITPSLIDRFWAKVQRGDGCWTWVGGTDDLGYGSINSGGHCGTGLLSHRVSYAIAHPDEDIAGAVICHHCDNPSCVNPVHLYAGTQADNMRDVSVRGRARNAFTDATHCQSGHEYTAESVWVYGRRDGGTERRCLICSRKKLREARRKFREEHPLPIRDACLRGHPLSGDNLRIADNGRRRRCRTCDKQNAREQSAKRRANH